ncbi:MAG: glycogen debranching protein [Bacteroidota bacterium]|nr:glycogen debranching protein [Bacteroidota bacterium]
MYKSDNFTVYPDRVEQGKYTARAVNDGEMTSDYQSAGAAIDPIIEFKFSINGRDNELPFGVNHQANIFPGSDGNILLNITFGRKSEPDPAKNVTGPLPQNTRVKFRVDFNPVLASFKAKGFYDDILGNRIFQADFKGLYLAGDTYPLNWDFENIPGNPDLRMEDTDGDGIFEKELTFNVYDASAHTSSTWKPANDISPYPKFGSSSSLLNAIYNMTLDEMVMLMEEDGTFRTGKEWAGVWTRDVSYATVLSLASLDPQRCMNSLMRKVADNRIIQDTGTGGAWPVSSDRVVWALAAWEIYKYTGDMEWLKRAYEIVKNSLEADSKTVTDPVTGLIRGESSFLDWRKQTYPLWMEPADIYGSLNLGTNAAYCQALRVTGMMAQELGEEDTWSDMADDLLEDINKQLWFEEKGYYGQYLYGRHFRSVSPRSEALGEAFSVLFDIADEEKKLKVLQNTPVTLFGITCIYPQIPGIPPYHNNGIWPFVQAFWTMANAECKQMDAVRAGLASIIRPAALFLTNKENFVAETGDFAGTEINSDRQLWSVAAMLAMYNRILHGISFGDDRMEFNPVIPESFSDTYTLTGIKYRSGTYDITVQGWGDGIASFRIDGKESGDHFIPAGTTGNHSIEIEMNRTAGNDSYNAVSNYTAPETPVLAVSGDGLSWNAIDNAAEYKIFRNGELISSTAGTTYKTASQEEAGEYQVMAADKNGTGSFLSNPVGVKGGSGTVEAEAEDFNIRSESRYPGFTGRGYVRFALPEDRELRISVKTTAGRYALRMRYANGTGPVNTDNNCGIRSLNVNGVYAGALVFPQRGKDEWSDWGFTFPDWIDLKEGDNTLTIKYEDFNRNMDGEINEFLLDRIILERFN